MEKLTVTLKTITPMFLTGADGKTPELRAPSIKGALRFWWRAIRSDLSIEKLREEEEKLFGGSDERVGRSKFTLFLQRTEMKVILCPPLPHHTGNKSCEYLDRTPGCKKNDKCSKGFPLSAIAPGLTFECVIRANKQYMAQVQSIFKISMILGGFGKRCRRGFGSVKIIKENGSDFKFDYSPKPICELLNNVVPNAFEFSGNKIKRGNSVHNDSGYPYIKEVEIGSGRKKYEDLLKVIGQSSHNNDCDQTGFVDNEKKRRFSSPIYVSVIKDNGVYKPIITRLNTAFEDNAIYPRTKKDKSTDFISNIVAGGCK